MLGMLSPPADTVTEFYSTTTTDPATNDDFTSTVQEEEPQSDVEMSHLALCKCYLYLSWSREIG